VSEGAFGEQVVEELTRLGCRIFECAATMTHASETNWWLGLRPAAPRLVQGRVQGLAPEPASALGTPSMMPVKAAPSSALAHCGSGFAKCK
jgi:hypothetical protein